MLVGEVWLCSGQSNMEWTLKRADNGAAAIAASDHPLLRLFHVKKTWSDTPLAEVPLAAAWAASSPETTPEFSAVGYFFGLELLKAFNHDIPIGLIDSSWGGTRIEPWTAPSGFAAIPALATLNTRVQSAIPGTPENRDLALQTIADHENWLAKARAAATALTPIPPAPEFPKNLRPLSADNPGRPQQSPTVLYNAMIAPLVPCALRGAIWYQGEANITEGMTYYEKLKALAASWRTAFENPEMPLHIVQIAPLDRTNGYTESLPEFWRAQERFAREDKRSGMAVINDIGNLKDIHPTNKQTVGKRLSLLALNKTYGRSDVACDSPAMREVRFVTGKTPGAAVLFDNAKTLSTRDGQPPDWFEIAGPDGSFRKAKTAIVPGKPIVMVSADGVSDPRVVRFAWSGIAEPNLRNEAGLQATAFTFGELPPPPELDTIGPDAAGYQLVYALDPLATTGHEVSYQINHAKQFAGKKIKRIAYLLRTTAATGATAYAFAAMDAFTDDVKKIGVPTKNSGARFQQNVANLVVKSNAPGVKNGAFKQGNIEFWDCNYAQQNAARVPGASDATFDFGDSMSTGASPGYGSMQIHNTAEKQTIIAYNHWSFGKTCDLGIGDQPKGAPKWNPDWTFSSSGKTLTAARLLVLVQVEE
ncbi:MAG: sialate O-acetylesterase [Opitutaceae bacterium]|nr:sialate O-acetylesterase [Opitutaceae bacterium]